MTQQPADVTRDPASPFYVAPPGTYANPHPQSLEVAGVLVDKPAKMSAEELAESMTGWDELAIAKMFGADLTDLDGARGLRAMAFISHKRAHGVNDREAYEAVMGMSLKQVMEQYDVEDADETVPDDPSTPAGKDVTPPASGPSF